MTKSCNFSLGERAVLSIISTIIILLYLLNGYTALCSEIANMQEATPAASNASNQGAKGSDLILGPGDKLAVTVYRHEDLEKTVQIDNSGKIVYPLVGEVQAGGLTVSQLRTTLRMGLAKYVVDPQVFVTILSVKSQNVIVLGEVNTPGLFDLDSPRTCLQMIALAGGFTKNANQKTVLLIRGGFKESELITLNLKRVFKDHDLTQNVPLRNGDIIYVPTTRIENIARHFDHVQRILATFYQAIVSGILTTSASN